MVAHFSTMRKIKYEDLKREKKERFRELIDLENRFEGRVAGNRPRDPEKEKVLIKLDKARMKRYIESGKLEILGPRHWRWRITWKKQDS